MQLALLNRGDSATSRFRSLEDNLAACYANLVNAQVQNLSLSIEVLRSVRQARRIVGDHAPAETAALTPQHYS